MDELILKPEEIKFWEMIYKSSYNRGAGLDLATNSADQAVLARRGRLLSTKPIAVQIQLDSREEWLYALAKLGTLPNIDRSTTLGRYGGVPSDFLCRVCRCMIQT